MTVEVLVYRGRDGDGAGVFGNVLGTDYTYKISTIDAPLSSDPNGISQAGDGFVYRGTGGDLIFSNGSEAGTTTIADDQNGNPISDPELFSAFGPESVFMADTASVPGGTASFKALFMTNGGATPTILLPSFNISEYQIVGDYVYALSQAGDLYRVDAAGHSMLIADQPSISNLFEFDGDLFFAGYLPNETHYYRVDHDTGAVTVLDDVPYSTYFRGVTPSGFYFWSYDPVTGIEPYISDGTGAGTHLVKDINSGSGNSLYIQPYAHYFTALGDKFIFIANAGGPEGYEVWVSDGSEAGTFALTGPEAQAAGGSVGDLGFTNFTPVTVNGLTFFQASMSGIGRELFVTDGTVVGTHLVKDINPGSNSSTPLNFYTDGDHFYFAISSGPNSDWCGCRTGPRRAPTSFPIQTLQAQS